MENLLTIKEKIKNVNDILQKIDKEGLSLIEKDIILQELRGLYSLVNNFEINEQNIVKPIIEARASIPQPIENEQKIIIEDTEENIVEFLDSEPVVDEPKAVVEIVETSAKTTVTEASSTQVKITHTNPVPEQQNLFGNSQPAGVVTVGDQLRQNNRSLNESLSIGVHSNDISSKLGQKPISDIKAAIGIGDRFLYIRELFNGNNDEFEQTITLLNSLSSFEEASNSLNDKYDWDYSHETVANFIGVVKRKYL